MKQILDAVVEVGFDKQPFLNYMKIKSVEKMLKSDLPKAMNAIDLKRKQGKK